MSLIVEELMLCNKRHFFLRSSSLKEEEREGRNTYQHTQLYEDPNEREDLRPFHGGEEGVVRCDSDRQSGDRGAIGRIERSYFFCIPGYLIMRYGGVRKG